METTKFCLDCKVTKPLDNFYVTKRGRVFSYCKPCGYARNRRLIEHPETRAPKRVAAIQSPADVWTHVDQIDGQCWPVSVGVSRNKDGYGALWFKNRTYLAHRLAWEATNGPIPAGLNVLHKCDNPPCCNPNHLFLGAQQDNVDDCIAKGRWRNRPTVVPDNVAKSALRTKSSLYYHLKKKGCSPEQIASHPRTASGKMVPCCGVCGAIGHDVRLHRREERMAANK